jgi:hypothetical protein
MAFVLFMSGALANASPTNKAVAARCSQKALKAAKAIFALNTPHAFGVRTLVTLVKSTPSESGTVLTWDIHFRDESNGESVAPYRIELLKDGCFVFGLSMPKAG